MTKQMRHAIYDSILELLSDHRRHDASELEAITNYPAQWLKTLEREPRIEVDGVQRRLRLQPE